MQKLDLKSQLKELYKPSKDKISWVNVPRLTYLAIDGRGDPNVATEYREAVEALCSLSYTLKFTIKKSANPIDYSVMPLEGQWWSQDMSTFSVQNKSDWLWTLMILQPSIVTAALFKQARAGLAAKKSLPALQNVRLHSFTEGTAAQVLHIGPFSEEGPTVAKLHAAISEGGYSLTGKHHEIYLSDIRRSDPTRWKTIIRQPYR